MPRVAKIVSPGLPHHVPQRGNDRQDVFFVNDDRRAYLALLKEPSEPFGLEVLAGAASVVSQIAPDALTLSCIPLPGATVVTASITIRCNEGDTTTVALALDVSGVLQAGTKIPYTIGG